MPDIFSYIFESLKKHGLIAVFLGAIIYIQFKQNETWVLYSKYADKGYTDIKQQVLDNGKVVYDRKWTQLGRKFLLELFEIE